VSESAFETPGKAMSGLPLAEPLVVRNELFEVRLSEVTGGIAQIRTYRRSPNRLSQQVAYRFPRERKFTVGEGDSQEQQTSFYTDMRMTESRVVSAGPDYGAVETFGVCVDPQTEEELAEFQQRLRLRPGRAVIELELELSPRRRPEGDPWTNYFGVRWAWKNEEAALTRSLHQTAQPVDDAPRLEAPYFIEIADGEFRTTILPCGLPYHRRIGPRMLDTLLMTAGEMQRRFQLAIAVDAPFPLEAALDAMAPPLVSSRLLGPPASPSGWLLQVSVRNVVLLGLQPLPAEAGAGTGTAAATGAGGSQESAAARTGLVARLLETDGRRRTFDLSCFRTPRAARQIDFTGRTIQEFRIAGDAVRVEIAPFELCDVELLF
jgi:alpha-mannosidase